MQVELLEAKTEPEVAAMSAERVWPTASKFCPFLVL